jgi:hypothetical protein
MMSSQRVMWALGLVVVSALGCTQPPRPDETPRFSSPFQAVLLDTGQVYYGKIEGLGNSYPVLRNVYYVQSVTNPDTKLVTNVLIRRGKEWHGPDFMVINGTPYHDDRADKPDIQSRGAHCRAGEGAQVTECAYRTTASALMASLASGPASFNRSDASNSTFA